MLDYNTAKRLSDIIVDVGSELGLKLEPVGSISRQSDKIKDLDFITSDLEYNRFFNDTLHYNGMPINLDIWSYDPKNKLFEKFARTGSKNFEIVSREQAKRRGYKLSNKGLFKNGHRVNVKDEKHLFSLIGRTYRPISQRI